MTPCLEDAIALAARAHRGQKDRHGEPYILHVVRVMLRQRDEAARIVGVLHDVLEDTPTTLADLLSAGYSQEICEAVDCLTRRAGEPYEEMIARVAANPIARRVKLADLDDNLDSRRQESTDDAVLARREKYKSAWNSLMALDVGEQDGSGFSSPPMAKA
jgi:(p)ppGpp synthase/HD superfamily hydrolase